MEGLQSLRLKDALYSQLVFQRNHFITKYMEIKIFIQQFEESLDGLDAGSVTETTAFKELKECSLYPDPRPLPSGILNK